MFVQFDGVTGGSYIGYVWTPLDDRFVRQSHSCICNSFIQTTVRLRFQNRCSAVSSNRSAMMTDR